MIQNSRKNFSKRKLRGQLSVISENSLRTFKKNKKQHQPRTFAVNLEAMNNFFAAVGFTLI